MLRELSQEKLTRISQTITRAMVNDLHLAAPAQFAWTKYNQRAWLLAALPREQLGKATESYFDPKTLRHLSDVVGAPVTASRRALVYLVLLSERPKLPTDILFPDSLSGKDFFAFGVSLRGTVRVSAPTMENVMIGATQNAGKSNLLKVITHTARFNGWPLYLADPQGHTFVPETWNPLAVEPVARSKEEFRALVAKVDAELKTREALFRQAAQARGGVPPADVEAYNLQAETPLSRFLLAVDEANDFLEDKSLESEMTRLAREGRKFGLHLVVAAHSWRDSRGKGVSREFSGRMTTRISLKVSDDTSGDVVLENTRWGKWVTRKQPIGRGVIRMNGQYTPLQVFHITDDMEAGWLANSRPKVVSPLTDVERDMVAYAVNSLDGQFKLREIAEHFGVTTWKVRVTADAWEKCGWLSPPADAVSSREVNDNLMGFAGVSRTGTQATQGHTGNTQAAQAGTHAAQGEEVG